MKMPVEFWGYMFVMVGYVVILISHRWPKSQ